MPEKCSKVTFVTFLFGFLFVGTVAQSIVLSPHSMKIPGLCPVWARMLFCLEFTCSLHIGLGFLCIIGELGTHTVGQVVWRMDGSTWWKKKSEVKWVQINLLLKVHKYPYFCPKAACQSRRLSTFFFFLDGAWAGLFWSFSSTMDYSECLFSIQIHSKIIVPWKREDGNKTHTVHLIFFLRNYWLLQFLVQTDAGIQRADPGVVQDSFFLLPHLPSASL